jgi:hypothetical protein
MQRRRLPGVGFGYLGATGDLLGQLDFVTSALLVRNTGSMGRNGSLQIALTIDRRARRRARNRRDGHRPHRVGGDRGGGADPALLLPPGYTGYAGLGLAVAIAAAINLL